MPTILDGGWRPATVSDLIDAYYRNSGFGTLSSDIQREYPRMLEAIHRELGSVPVADVCRRDVIAFRDAKAQVPSAANRRLFLLRALMRHAVDMGWCGDDPTAGVTRLPIPMPKRPCWSEEDITLFEERHQPGSDARRAAYLPLYAGQRPFEMVASGAKHVDGDRILSHRMRRGMNGSRGIDVWVPLHPALRAEITQAPENGETFLADMRGRALTVPALGRRFRRWCDEAGLPRLSASGLREAGAVRLVESGCSVDAIQYWLGRKPLVSLKNKFGAAAEARWMEEELRKHLR